MKKEAFLTTYGTIDEETIAKVVENFKSDIYSDFQHSAETTKTLIAYNEKEQELNVDRYLELLKEDLKPHLIKALSDLIATKKEELNK